MLDLRLEGHQQKPNLEQRAPIGMKTNNTEKRIWQSGQENRHKEISQMDRTKS